MPASYRPSIPLAFAVALAATLGGCGGGDEPAVRDEGLLPAGAPLAEEVPWIDVTLPLFPAEPRARHAEVLSQCVWGSPRSAPCVLKLLPTLQQPGSAAPTIDEIMGRVLVSHDWQAARFRELLERMPQDMRRLFRPVTAIVISNDVRPAFYWSYTGAIYLDPAYLWVTPAERATLDTTPDFRSAYGLDLQFTMPWRYVKDDAYAYRSNPPDGTTRTLDEVTWLLARLLFHELGHANDFTSQRAMAHLDNFDSVYEAALYNYGYDVGVVGVPRVPPVFEQLRSFAPLASDTMYGLADVRFQGYPSTATQRALTPADVAGHFAPDRASDHYGYSAWAEDVAMLLEEAMMHRHFGVERDVAVTNLPTVANPTAADYVVTWGVRGRVRDAAVKARAIFAIELLLPEALIETRNWGAALPPPQAMPAGSTWADTVVLTAPASADAARKRQAALAEPVTSHPDVE